MLDEFVRICSSWDAAAGRLVYDGGDTMYYVPRVLFDVPSDAPEAEMPPSRSIPVAAFEKDVRTRHPIALVDDVPFYTPANMVKTGAHSTLEYHVTYFKKHGKLRAAVLSPPGSVGDSIQHLVDSKSWVYGNENAGLYSMGFVLNQLLQLIDTVYPAEPSSKIAPIFHRPEDVVRIVDEIKKLQIRWDPEQMHYVFLDGTILEGSSHPTLEVPPAENAERTGSQPEPK